MVSVLLLMAGALASQGWTEAARTEIPDRINVELELGELGIAPESASYLGGESRWRSRPGGETHQEHTLRWLRLSASPILEATAPDEARSHCEQIAGHDPIPGGREIHLYRSGASPSDIAAQVALRAQPGMVLASTDTGEIALVTLQPGDQVLLVDVQHNRSGARSEHIELRRGLRWLSLTRDDLDPEACYGQDRADN